MLKKERAILKGFEKRDDRIIKNFINDHYEKFENFIKSKGGSDDDVADIFQETMLVLFNVACKNDFILKVRVVDYAFGIMKNFFYAKFREKIQLDFSIDDDKGVEIAEENDELGFYALQNERFRLYEKHLNAIDKDCQKIFKLANSGKELSAIINDMGYSPTYYYKKKSVCKKKINGKYNE